MLSCLKANAIEVADELINRGADVNLCDKVGRRINCGSIYVLRY